MEICMGTAQFGLDYGISNDKGKVSPDTVHMIINKAFNKGIRFIDTSPCYGESEELIGQLTRKMTDIKIITKIMPLKKKKIGSEDIMRLRQNFIRSLKRLDKHLIYGIMINNFYEIMADGGDRILDLLREYKDKGYVEKIGIYLNYPIEIEHIKSIGLFDFVQVPLNVFDQRLLIAGTLKKLRSQGLEVFARSIFLQGLLLMQPEKIDYFFLPIMPIIKNYHKFLYDNGLSPLEGALCFINQVNEIDIMLMGLTSEKELENNINAFEKIRNISLDFSNFSIENEDMINPSKWKIK